MGPGLFTSGKWYRYYLSLLDDYKRYTWIFPLIAKSETTRTIINFITQIERTLERKVKCIQSDWSGEFRPLKGHIERKWIVFSHLCLYTSTQNENVERKHRHIIETALTLLA